MATSREYVEFVCGQLEGVGAVRYRKMFGEYMVYLDEKPMLLVCDNTVYVKKLPQLAACMADAACGAPYEGAKEHYILDIDDAPRAREVAALAMAATPLPKPKRKKTV